MRPTSPRGAAAGSVTTGSEGPLAEARRRGQAAEERAAELAKANEALRGSVARMAGLDDVGRSIEAVLMAFVEQTGAVSAALFQAVSPAAVRMRAIILDRAPADLARDPRLAMWRRPFEFSEFRDGWEQMLHHPNGYAVQEIQSAEPGMAAGAGEWHLAQGHRSVIHFPLLRGSDPVGFIGLAFDRPFDLTAPAIELARALAGQATLALEMVRLAEKARETAVVRAREQAAEERAAELAKVNDSLRRGLDRVADPSQFEDFVTALLLESAQAFQADAAAVILREENGTVMRPVAVVDDGRLFTLAEIAGDFFLGTFAEASARDPAGIFSRICAMSHHQVEMDDELRRVWPQAHAWHTARGHRVSWQFPLRVRGETRGFFAFALRRAEPASNTQVESAAALAQQFTLALELIRLGEEAKALAVSREREQAAQQRATELARANQALEEEVAARRRAEEVALGQTIALARTLSLLSADPALDSFLGQVLTAVTEALHAPAATLYFHDPASDTLSLHATCHEGRVFTGADQLGHPSAVEPFPADLNGFWRVLVATRRPVEIADVENDPLLEHHGWLSRAGVRSLLIAPLLAGGSVLGFLGVRFYEAPRRARPEEPALAQALAQLATLAVELTRLAERARAGEVLAERQRIARDLHDVLAQGFVGVLTQLGVLEGALEEGDPAEVRRVMDRVRDIAREGLEEARRSVHALRPPGPAGPIAERLQELAHHLTAGTGLRVEAGETGAPGALSPEADWAVVKFVQQALTNTLRHAGAGSFRLGLEWSERGLALTARDDGAGFDPQAPRRGIGLRGMAERAADCGGSFQIESAPGAGTALRLFLPRQTPAA